MDFSISDRMQGVLARVRSFLLEHVYPLEARLHSESFASLLPTLEAKRQLVREMGFFAPQIPKKHGGMGLEFMDHALLSEELARTPLGHFVFNCQAPDEGNMHTLLHWATDDQKDRFFGRGKYARA